MFSVADAMVYQLYLRATVHEAVNPLPVLLSANVAVAIPCNNSGQPYKKDPFSHGNRLLTDH